MNKDKGSGNHAAAQLQKSASDCYFQAHSRRPLSSQNVFAQQVDALVSPATPIPRHVRLLATLSSRQQTNLGRWLVELQEGFNLILYGYGSKADLLRAFGDRCVRLGDVIRVNGWHENVKFHHVLSQIEDLCCPDSSSFRGGLESRASAVADACSANRPLHILISSLDTLLRTEEEKLAFCALARRPCIRILATVEQLRSPLIWSLHCSSSRKHASSEARSHHVIKDTARWSGLNLVWHDATSLQPYEAEMIQRKIHVPPTFRSSKAATTDTSEFVSLTAANHILASVTDRARRLFQLIAGKQLANNTTSDEAQTSDAGSHPREQALSYAATFVAARDAFLASNDAQMKSLLSEFTDHGIVRLANSVNERESSGEVLWIAMKLDSLRRLFHDMEKS